MMNRSDFAPLGFGVGLRRPHYVHVLEQHPAMDWFEVISENFMVEGGRPLEVLEGVLPTLLIGTLGGSARARQTALLLDYLTRTKKGERCSFPLRNRSALLPAQSHTGAAVDIRGYDFDPAALECHLDFFQSFGVQARNTFGSFSRMDGPR